MELLAVAIVGLAALAALLLPHVRAPGRTQALALVAALVALAGAGAWLSRPPKAGGPADPLTAKRPVEVRADGYVSSDSCRACHPDHYASWHHSYHRTMTQVATPETLVSDWDGTTLTWRGKTYHLSRRGDQFWVDMVDPEYGKAGAIAGKPIASDNLTRRVEKRVVLMTGSHHQQVYWVTSGVGREVHLFAFTWLIAEQRWIPYADSFVRGDLPHEQTEVWNEVCIVCHSTSGRPRPDDETGVLDTQVVEFGIACEACHGPGEAHVRRNRDPARRYLSHLSPGNDTTITQPDDFSPRLSSHVCGQCHGIFGSKTEEVHRKRWQHGSLYRPGADLYDTRLFMWRPTDPAHPLLQRAAAVEKLDGSFWGDGMVRVSGREFNGLIESPCYGGGEFTCLSCHSMHEYTDRNDQLAPRMGGDEACLQCHGSFRDRIEEHTHHPAGSAGSACYNCHMPHTTYGLFSAIRSHTVSSPSIRESVTHGRPNACNLCHLDRTLGWTKDRLEEWYGREQDAVGDEDKERSAALLWLLRGDAGQRALAAWSLGWEPAKQASGEGWLAPFLAHALDDPYAAVRHISHRSLRRLPGFEDFAYDFVGPRGTRQQAAERARDLWRDTPELDRSGPAVFIDENGRLDEEALRDVVRRRDERFIFLAE